MALIAKLFTNGRSQAVRLLPAPFRFDGSSVFIRQDPQTGDVILSRKPPDWDSFLSAVGVAGAPPEFLAPSERGQDQQGRDPFEGWDE